MEIPTTPKPGGADGPAARAARHPTQPQFACVATTLHRVASNPAACDRTYESRHWMLDSTVCGSSTGIPRRPGPASSSARRADAARRGCRRPGIDAARGGGDADQLRLGGEAAQQHARPGHRRRGRVRRCGILQCGAVLPYGRITTIGQDSGLEPLPNRPGQTYERPLRAAPAAICPRSSGRSARSVVEIHNETVASTIDRPLRRRRRSPPSRSSLGPPRPTAVAPRT